MILIVSDTSAIRALAYVSCLEFLPQLFDKVIIPVAVNEELIHPPSKFQSIDVKDFGFIEVRSPSDADGVSSLIADLDAGEAEAIALAIELNARWLLIDERAGRLVAQQHGLAVIGTIGVLLRFKDVGLIDRISPKLDVLQQDLGFFLSPSLRERIRQLANESEQAG